MSSYAQRMGGDEVGEKSGGGREGNGGAGILGRKRSNYHRQTPQQIQEMENFFKDSPHPSKRQREELSQRLGMEPMKVKFWFQNKRTQMKMRYEKHENLHLRTENERLLAENKTYREALSTARCSTCGAMAAVPDMSDEERTLRMENARLRVEINRISAMAAKYVGKPLGDSATTATLSSSGQ